MKVQEVVHLEKAETGSVALDTAPLTGAGLRDAARLVSHCL